MLSNLLQKFKHNYTNIWIWKFCLLKIYLNYRELMTTGCWQQRNDSNSKRKLQEKFFLNSQNFLQLYNIFFLQLTLTELLNPCRPLSRLLELSLMKPFAVLFIGEALGFKKALPLWCHPTHMCTYWRVYSLAQRHARLGLWLKVEFQRTVKNHSPKKGPESGESNWVMHQYHFGTKEDVREVEYVVAKVPYRP